MVKLKLLSLHDTENIPDHLIHEMEEFSIKLLKHNMDLINSVQSNIALAGVGWMLPCLLKHLVTENAEELRKAAKFSCCMLLNNMEILIKEMEKI